jgi:hypothetical protein
MGDTRQKLERDLRVEFPGKNPVYSGYDLEGIGARTVQAIETPKINVSLPLDLAGTPFHSASGKHCEPSRSGNLRHTVRSPAASALRTRLLRSRWRVWPIGWPWWSLAIAPWMTAALVTIDGDRSANVWCSTAKPGTRRLTKRPANYAVTICGLSVS